MPTAGQRELDHVFDRLERELPARLARAVRWLRSPTSRWVRIPIGVLFIAGGVLWFLPILGLEMLPIGLLLLAQDVPILQKPLARALLWLERKWLESKRWYTMRAARAC